MEPVKMNYFCILRAAFFIFIFIPRIREQQSSSYSSLVFARGCLRFREFRFTNILSHIWVSSASARPKHLHSNLSRSPFCPFQRPDFSLSKGDRTHFRVATTVRKT
ncbi:hypothetical protein AA313_de0208757 [Arthrobotrys entomopaga]|nr:hypothetical protein AA313_de0208757 [Arthrobotrys entomopaga]